MSAEADGAKLDRNVESETLLNIVLTPWAVSDQCVQEEAWEGVHY